MNIPSHIHDKLQQLKLNGIINAYPERHQEAVANQMTPVEFLSLLLEDEVQMRQVRRYQRRYRSSGLPNEKTVETFDFSFNPKINQSLVRDLMTCRFIEERVPVILIGPCGTGKSHLAQAIGHSAIQREYDVLFTTQSKLTELLQNAKATEQYEKKLNALAKIPLLIIDDLGLKPLRPPQDEYLHDLVAERYEKTSTIVTSNLAFGEWHQAFANQLLAAATLDRLRDRAYHLEWTGRSYRSKRKT